MRVWLSIFLLLPWLAIGTDAHDGTPEWGDDLYPNSMYFVGQMGDVRIYNRTLAAGEVSALYASTNYSAPVVAPAITVQPQSQTNYVGSNVTFTVTATGTAPLSYLWRFNSGATAKTNLQGKGWTVTTD
jgi:hypothetical protein